MIAAMLAHWDEVAWARWNRGPVDGRWQLLGQAAGSVEVGLRRIRVDPGAQPTPAHRHHREEEIYFVLDGGGLLVRDDLAHEVRAGDAIVELARGPAHTFVGGEDGLELLAFGTRDRAETGEMPRAGTAWLARGLWVETNRGAYPLEREPRAEPPPPSPRPGSIVALADVDADHHTSATVGRTRRNLGRAAGSRRVGVQHVGVEPGLLGTPPHCHSVEEEVFVVLGGEGTLELGDERVSVRRGHVVSRPAGTRVAHAFRAGPGGLEYLAFGTRDPGDVCFYPRSGQVALRGIGVVFRPEALDYWDGEL